MSLETGLLAGGTVSLGTWTLADANRNSPEKGSYGQSHTCQFVHWNQSSL